MHTHQCWMFRSLYNWKKTARRLTWASSPCSTPAGSCFVSSVDSTVDHRHRAHCPWKWAAAQTLVGHQLWASGRTPWGSWLIPPRSERLQISNIICPSQLRESKFEQLYCCLSVHCLSFLLIEPLLTIF